MTDIEHTETIAEESLDINKPTIIGEAPSFKEQDQTNQGVQETIRDYFLYFKDALTPKGREKIAERKQNELLASQELESQFRKDFETLYPDTTFKEGVKPHPIILLHGQGRDATRWFDHMRELRKLDKDNLVPIIAFSLPKFGTEIPGDIEHIENSFIGNEHSHDYDDGKVRSIVNKKDRENKYKGSEVTLESLSKSIQDEMDRLGIDGPVTIVGHSLGGLVGTMIAADNPERVANLITVSSPLRGGDQNPPQAFSTIIEKGKKVPNGFQEALEEARSFVTFLADYEPTENFLTQNPASSFAICADEIYKTDWKRITQQVKPPTNTALLTKNDDSLVQLMGHKSEINIQHSSILYAPSGGHAMIKPQDLRRMIASMENSES